MKWSLKQTKRQILKVDLILNLSIHALKTCKRHETCAKLLTKFSSMINLVNLRRRKLWSSSQSGKIVSFKTAFKPANLIKSLLAKQIHLSKKVFFFTWNGNWMKEQLAKDQSEIINLLCARDFGENWMFSCPKRRGEASVNSTCCFYRNPAVFTSAKALPKSGSPGLIKSFSIN